MRDRGSATVLGLVVVSVLVLVTAGLAAVGRVMAAHMEAGTAADGAALAAAPLTFLPGDPGGEAAEYAARNGAQLVACACGTDSSPRRRVVTVEVRKEVDLPLFGMVTVRRRAAAEFDPLDLLGG